MARQSLEFPVNDQYDPRHSVREEMPALSTYNALDTEQELLEAYHNLETARSDEKFLDEYNNRNILRTKAPRRKRVMGWLALRLGVNKKPKEAISHLEERTSEVEKGIEARQQDLEWGLDSIKRQVGELPSYEQEKLETGLERRLGDYTSRHDIDPDNIAFRKWKKQAEKEQGRTLTWRQWIARSVSAPDKAGVMSVEDRQLLNFLQWNQAEFTEANNSPELKERLGRLDKKLGAGIDSAVGKGYLDEQIYRNFILHATEIIVGDPLDFELLSSNAYGMKNTSAIVMSLDFKDGTYIHERTHKLGGFVDPFWNEAATQIVADIIEDKEGDEVHSTPYDLNIGTLIMVVDAAGMSIKEMSAYYAGYQKSGSFFDEIKRRTGVDVFSDFLKIRDETSYAANGNADEAEWKLQLGMYNYAKWLKDHVGSHPRS